jgi:hypothetical protein
MLKFKGIMYQCETEYRDCAFAPLAGWMDGYIRQMNW